MEGHAMKVESLSPTIVKKVEEQLQGVMKFPAAMNELIHGKKIHKLEWKDKQYFAVLKDNRVKLHKPDGQFYDWILSDGDVLGEDWVVV